MAKDLPVDDSRDSFRGIGGERAQKILRKERAKLPKVKSNKNKDKKEK